MASKKTTRPSAQEKKGVGPVPGAKSTSAPASAPAGTLKRKPVMATPAPTSALHQKYLARLSPSRRQAAHALMKLGNAAATRPAASSRPSTPNASVIAPPIDTLATVPWTAPLILTPEQAKILLANKVVSLNLINSAGSDGASGLSNQFQVQFLDAQGNAVTDFKMLTPALDSSVFGFQLVSLENGYGLQLTTPIIPLRNRARLNMNQGDALYSRVKSSLSANPIAGTEE